MSKFIKDKNLCYWKTKHLFKKVSIILVLTLIIQSMYGYNTYSAEQDTYTDAVPDTEAPSSPANLTVSAVSGSAITIIPNTHSEDIIAAVSGSSITLSWNAASDNIGVEGYKVYSNDTLIGTSDKTEYIYFGLVNGSTYKVYVTAYDKAGNESFQSNKVKLNTDYQNITADIQPPSTPTNVLLSAVSGSAILLVWDASTDDIGIEGYEVYKNGVMIGFTEETNFIDNDFNADINDLYSIAAFDLAGNRSIESEAVSFKLQVEENPYEYKTDRFIVKYKNEKGKANLKDYLKNNLKENRKFNKNYLEVIVLDKKVKPEDFINDIKEKKNNKKSSFDYNSDIEYIQPDYQFMASSADPYFGQQWGVENPQIEETDQLNDDMVDSEVMYNADEFDLGLPEIPGMVDSNPQPDVTGNTSDEDTTQDNNTETSELLAIDADVSSAWNLSKGEGVVVAVLDTGIDITQEDLKDNIWINQGETPNNGIDDDHNGFIDDINGWNFADNTNQVHNPMNVNDEWHGTHIAGIIAAEEDNNSGITGVAPDAAIMPLKVFHDGIAYTSDIIAALEYAEAMGVKIVNCSWGSTEDNPALKEAIDNSDMLFVCAAGNSLINIDNHPVYPAAYGNENVISVASIGKTGILSAFSNYGEVSVDVTAPGEDIISTFPGNEYMGSSGTSMAAAFVSGAAALLLGINRDYKATDLKERIISTSDHLSSLKGKINNGNKLNCYNAILNIVSSNIIEINTIDYNNYSISDVYSQNNYTLYSGGVWTQRDNLSVTITSPECVSLNGCIYEAGGNSNSRSAYKYSNGYWIPISNMNVYRNGHVLAAANGKVYAIGGIDESAQNTVEIYDPSTNKWTLLTTTGSLLPTAVRYACAAVINDIIYVMGGNNIYGNPVNIVQAFDTKTNTWSSKRSMLKYGSYPSATVLNGKIYVADGYIQNTMEMYDPITDTWTLKAGISSGLCIAALEGNLYYFGSNIIYVYSPLSNSWTQCTSSLSPEVSVALNNEIYVLGRGVSDSFFWSYKPNDGNDMANAINVQEEKETLNQIDYIGDQDYYTFTANNSTSYDIATTGSFDTYGYLYNSSGTLIAENDDYAGDINFHITSNLTAGSKYYVRVRHKNDSSTGIYGLRITKTLTTPGNVMIIPNYDYINITWSSVPYASSYEIEVDGTIVNCGSNISYLHSNLQPNIVHTYRIRAKGNINYSNWSSFQFGTASVSTWQIKNSMPTSRVYLGTVNLNGKIYTIGGYNGVALNKVEEYDTVTGAWTFKANMQVARYGLGVVECNGKIYAIGGYNGSTALTTVEEYNPATNTWTTKASMPIAKYFFGIAAYNGKIYVIGGHNGSSHLNSTEIYNPITNSWSSAAAMPTARNRLSVAVFNDKLYVIGGYNGSYLNTTEEFNIETNTWTSKANMPTARDFMGSYVINGKIYAIGGFNSNGNINLIEEFDAVTNTWKVYGNKLLKSHGFGISVINETVYIIGGYSSTYTYLSTIESVTLPKVDATLEYIYDTNNRLKEIRRLGITVVKFIYDKNGNLTNVQLMV